ncbi:MAG: DNA topoisomerase 4 subunit A [Lachnospiraceae bacterium]|jgi:DNA gyrase subunit A|nr:DNA topoisomerase 4 subunit A [Lachnospiraceae bacterium]
MQDTNIIRTEYSEVMQKSYIDYAMSVIVARALPDVRDGLKPVQRRTLYDMYELGIKSDKPYKKCARIVGDTMGKYHPHGDSSIYDALVVMAQDFKKGIKLVDGHGNFGSIEGDGAAAMRYTEARLAKLTDDVYLADLDKNIVDFVPNFDETEKEPSVLPVRIPNILVNGAEGIAVGMATSIPTHNLGEVIDAVKAYMKKDSITTKELMKYIKGPDFPTGGIVVNEDALLDIYEQGMGKIKLRGKVEIEKKKGGKVSLVVTEIPYTMIGAGIGKFLNDVIGLVEHKVTSDIIDVSNQSSKDGIRIVIDLKKDADPENIINMLYKKTGLENTFGVNMLAVSGGRPKTLGLKNIIEENVEFQFELAERKYNTLLSKEKDKSEIQEGLIKATDVIDLIIEILRGSKNVKDVRACLTSGIVDNIKFKSDRSKKMAKLLHFTDRQTTAILEMRLQKLIGLEVEALIKEHEDTLKNIALYEDILNNYDSMANVIIKDLDRIKKEFATPRKTEITNASEAVFEEKPIEAQDVYFLVDRFGYGKVIDESTYERNKENADSESKYVIKVLNFGKIAVFTNTGIVHTIKIMDLPLSKFRDKGTPIDNVSKYDSAKERIVAICNYDRLKEDKVLFATKKGMIKQVDGNELIVSTKAAKATKIDTGDELVYVSGIKEEEQVVLATHDGYFLRFGADQIPEKKKGAIGVRGIKLSKGDYLESVYIFIEGTEKKVPFKDKEVTLNRLKVAKRDGVGTKQR